MYDCVFLITRHKVSLEKIHNSDNINISVQLVLYTGAFFDNLNAIAFVLHPIKLAISILESQYCLLANCFIGLVHLEAAIRKFLENDYCNFHQQAITVFNRRFADFNNDAYILCFFLHSEYTRTFWHILLVADSFYKKICKKLKERKILMSQMRSYRHHITPFDILFDDNESPSVWWMLLENKLLYFSSNTKNLYKVLSNINFCDDDYNKHLNEERPVNEEKLANEERLANDRRPWNKERLANEEPTNEEMKDIFILLEVLKIDELLNLDATDFTNNLGELIVDTNFEFPDEKNIIVQDNNIENDEDWNSKRETNAMLN
ncbi:4052_t:CDS:2 [Dentiscutata heterogama]|uniref:4052_t:CDS:1 n=1 Tax=Dentiscutata heterogama TaxID=1316150 RepID=A0ACA9M078_9GLOM|nr:4052_t:CDS:2 [Dentiscutata heterogama]